MVFEIIPKYHQAASTTAPHRIPSVAYHQEIFENPELKKFHAASLSRQPVGFS